MIAATNLVRINPDVLAHKLQLRGKPWSALRVGVSNDTLAKIKRGEPVAARVLEKITVQLAEDLVQDAIARWLAKAQEYRSRGGLYKWLRKAISWQAAMTCAAGVICSTSATSPRSTNRGSEANLHAGHENPMP